MAPTAVSSPRPVCGLALLPLCLQGRRSQGPSGRSRLLRWALSVLIPRDARLKEGHLSHPAHQRLGGKDNRTPGHTEATTGPGSPLPPPRPAWPRPAPTSCGPHGGFGSGRLSPHFPLGLGAARRVSPLDETRSHHFQREGLCFCSYPAGFQVLLTSVLRGPEAGRAAGRSAPRCQFPRRGLGTGWGHFVRTGHRTFASQRIVPRCASP